MHQANSPLRAQQCLVVRAPILVPESGSLQSQVLWVQLYCLTESSRCCPTWRHVRKSTKLYKLG